MNLYDCVLVFNSQNAMQDQFAVIDSLRRALSACNSKTIAFPTFSAMVVSNPDATDSPDFPAVSVQNGMTILTFKPTQEGNGKSDLRKAVAVHYKIAPNERNNG
jgi:hypothetical protein